MEEWSKFLEIPFIIMMSENKTQSYKLTGNKELGLNGVNQAVILELLYFHLASNLTFAIIILAKTKGL